MEPAILMMNANCHFGTLRYPLIMYTIFVYLCRPLLGTTNKMVLNCASFLDSSKPRADGVLLPHSVFDNISSFSLTGFSSEKSVSTMELTHLLCWRRKYREGC